MWHICTQSLFSYSFCVQHVTCLQSYCATHSYVGHDSFVCGTWLIHMWDMNPYMGHDSFICGTWLNMSHVYKATVRRIAKERLCANICAYESETEMWHICTQSLFSSKERLCANMSHFCFGLICATSSLHTIIGLFCQRALWKRVYSAKETDHFKEPTNRRQILHS